MPMQRDLYPDDWEAISFRVKTEANWCCEECGKRCRRPGEDLLQFFERLNYFPLEDLFEHPQRWTLTVAHLDHQPQNCDRTNLKALCAPCHCRYDLKQMARKRRLKLERQGQLTLNLGGLNDG
ncbi:MAG: HNH endonuclease [Leptolyngbyaceae cyanobacterium SL_5_9]|nr:HNH endonuclease [Leptolyngbyaceae cyanobacterium SL_5_9]